MWVVYVDDLFIAGPRSLNDTVIKAIQEAWKTSHPEHIGPDPDCVPILRFLGVNLERVDAEYSTELNLPVGSILLNQMEVSSISVNIYIMFWAMRCDMFQYLLSPSINCVPPLLQQGRRLNKD